MLAGLSLYECDEDRKCPHDSVGVLTAEQIRNACTIDFHLQYVHADTNNSTCSVLQRVCTAVMERVGKSRYIHTCGFGFATNDINNLLQRA